MVTTGMIDETSHTLDSLRSLGIWVSSLGGAILTFIFGRYSSRKQKVNGQLDKLERAHYGVDKKIAILESEILILKDDIKEVKDKVNTIIDWAVRKRNDIK